MSEITVSDILIYPIKGAQGVSVKSAEFTTEGLVGDRVFTITRDGKRMAQRKIPAIKYLRVTRCKQGLELNYPGEKAFLLAVDSSSPGEPLMSITRTIATLDMGDAVASWLSRCLQATVRLVKAQGPEPLPISLAEFKLIDGLKQSKFVDIAPVLLTNEASLLDLNTRLSEPVLMNRFRPNLVVSGLQPYQEDQIRHLVFPSMRLEAMVACERCKVTTFSQETDVASKEPLRTLSRYRRRENDYAGGVMFGTYLASSGNGAISVGEQVILADSAEYSLE
jgi:hypothetical protein